MSFFSFGRRVKPKKFDYIPMHYDAAKEELEARMASYGQTEISDTELAKARIRSGIRMKARGNPDLLKAGKKEANIRLLLIVILLVAASYFFIRSQAFNEFVNRLLT